jgi:hypothetical protein
MNDKPTSVELKALKEYQDARKAEALAYAAAVISQVYGKQPNGDFEQLRYDATNGYHFTIGAEMLRAGDRPRFVWHAWTRAALIVGGSAKGAAAYDPATAFRAASLACRSHAVAIADGVKEWCKR